MFLRCQMGIMMLLLAPPQHCGQPTSERVAGNVLKTRIERICEHIFVTSNTCLILF